VPELIAAIQEYAHVHNTIPKPFIWTAKDTAILQNGQPRQSALKFHLGVCRTRVRQTLGGIPERG